MPRDKNPRLHYRYPWPLILQVGWALARGRRRSFPADAGRLYWTISPPPYVQGLERVPTVGGLLLVFNHYHSPSFASWMSAVSIAALIGRRRPQDDGVLTWVMTGAWTYPDALRDHTLTPLSHLAFARLARVYGFVAMPPMPPRPHEVEARARAVRRVLALARCTPSPLVGLSPEGHDSPDASLLVPPAGVGRFLLLLAAALTVQPVGVYEEGALLNVHFGQPFTLSPASGLAAGERDAWASDQIMLAIGRLLPPRLWGAYHQRLAAATGATAAPATFTTV